MENYKAQYYNEALMHYGVKGMKWGVRRKRAAAYTKALGKTMATNAKHPFVTSKQLKSMKKGKNFKTRARMATIGLNTKELNKLNKGVAKTVAQKNRKSKVRKGIKAAVEYTKAYHKLGTNKLLHPIRTKVAKINMQAGRDTSLTTKEMNAINEAVKARGIKMKALKAQKRRKKQAQKRK